MLMYLASGVETVNEKTKLVTIYKDAHRTRDRPR